jgi:ABC-type transport system substrate-binding protein
MKKVSLASITVALLTILAITVVPAYSWCIPPNPAGENNKYETYGPHVKGILIKIYADTQAEWTDMDAGHLDFEDWALGASWAAKWSTPGGPITEQNYGSEASYYILDINNNWTCGGDGTPVPVSYDNPTRELVLRQAIAYCANRSYIVNDICKGLVNPIYTPVPTYMAGYVNHDIRPGGARSDLTYGGYNGDPDQGAALLNASGRFPIGGDGWRYWDKNGNANKDPSEDLTLTFYSMQGDRGVFGDALNNAINTKLKIKTDYHRWLPIRALSGPVFANRLYQLYTGAWTCIGPDPDYLCDLYNGSNYYYPGSPPNYDGINDPQLNANLTMIKLAPDFAAGTTATLNSQVRFSEICASVPLWCASGVKAYSNVPVEDPSGNWTDIMNQRGVGVNSWWSTLNMFTLNNLYPNFYAEYGFWSTISLLNPVYAQWYWDREVLGRIYDSGAARDPMTLASWIPQLFQSWEVGTWLDPVRRETKTKVTIKVRPDIYWQDGVPFTVNDVLYTFTEMSEDLIFRGFPPPWWYPTVQYMRSVSIVDPYTIEVLLDVYNVWATGWVLGSIIIPKHIWKPIVDSSINDGVHNYVQLRQPDADCIGTGPFRWSSGVGEEVGSTVTLVANTPGSVVRGVTSPGYYQYCPVEVNIWSLLEFENTTAIDISNPSATPWKMDKPFLDNQFILVNWTDVNMNGIVDEDDTVFLVNATRNDLLYGICFPPKGKYYTVWMVEPPSPEHPTTYHLKVIYCKAKFNIPHPPVPAQKVLPLALGIEITNRYLNTSNGGYLVVNKYIYIDGVLQPGYPKDATLYTLDDGTIMPDKEEINVNTTWGHHNISVAVHVTDPATLTLPYEWDSDTGPIPNRGTRNSYYTVPNPWISQWINVTLHCWVTVVEDIGGTTFYDIIGLKTYKYSSELPAPDCKVNVIDILVAAKAFASFPGDWNWSPTADANKDYKVNIIDLLTIAKGFGIDP